MESVEGFRIRAATAKDVTLILSFIRELAEYERLEHEVVATEAGLRHSLFGPEPEAEVVFGVLDEKPVGFALFFHNYSTFLGKRGLYLEDLFVRSQFRGRGFGRAMLVYLARLAVQRDCGRLEWWVLDWNADAIRFYQRVGARAIDEVTVYRLTGEALNNLAQESV